MALGHIEAEKVMLSAMEMERIDDVSIPEKKTPTKQLVIALAGQPNVGKSTVFNLLTGLNQHVGNWAGKTVDLKSGGFMVGDASVTLVDLPGTYSLTASSEEERIARDFILREHPDLTIVVVDAANWNAVLSSGGSFILACAGYLVLNMIGLADMRVFRWNRGCL